MERSIQFPRNARLPHGVRLIVYAYLSTEELLLKASQLCRYEREKLPNSQIACSDRAICFDLYSMVDVMAFHVEHVYYRKLISEIKITAIDIDPRRISAADFGNLLVNLPRAFWRRKVSLTINARERFNKVNMQYIEKVFNYLLVMRKKFAFKTLEVRNYDLSATATGPVLGQFLRSKELYLENVKLFKIQNFQFVKLNTLKLDGSK